MTAFARSDINGITIPPEAGGCGELHAREATNEIEIIKAIRKKQDPPAAEYSAEPFGVDCVHCEPILIAVHGWSRDPHDVELTPDEERTKERLEKEGTAATNAMASELGRQLAAAAREGLTTSGQ